MYRGPPNQLPSFVVRPPVAPPYVYRPPMVVNSPQIITPHAHGQPINPPLTSVVPTSHPFPPATIIPQVHSTTLGASTHSVSSGPVSNTIVYVGNIAPEVEANAIQQLLAECGKILRWTRTSDPKTGKLAAFGFCEFEEMMGAHRAVKLLDSVSLGDRALKVTCQDRVRTAISNWRSQKIMAMKNANLSRTTEQVEAEFESDDEKARASIHKLALQQSEQIKLKAEEEQQQGAQETSNASKSPAASSENVPASGEEGEKGGSEAREKPSSSIHAPSTPPQAEADAPLPTQSDSPKTKSKSAPELPSYLPHDYKPHRREKERAARILNRARDTEREYFRRERDFERYEESLKKKMERNEKMKKEDFLPNLSADEKRQIASIGLKKGHVSSSRKRHDRMKLRQREVEDDEADRMKEAEELEEEKQRLNAEKLEAEVKAAEAAAAASDKKIAAAKAKDVNEDEEIDMFDVKSSIVIPEKEEAAVDVFEKEAKDEAHIIPIALKREVQSSQVDAGIPPMQKGPAEESSLYWEGERKSQPVNERANDMEPKATHSSTIVIPSATTKTEPVSMSAVFGNNEDEGGLFNRKHRPLTKLEEHRDQKNQSQHAESMLRIVEDTKKILAMVPSETEEIFNFPLKWDLIKKKDVIESKLQPWVKRKIIEYMGSGEGLVDAVIVYVIQQVNAEPDPRALLADLEKFLDEEAEGFLKNMWRMLIFDQLRIENKNTTSTSSNLQE